MRVFLILTISALLVISCQRTDPQVLQEIQTLEYQRSADPDKFIPWLNSTDPNIRAQAVKSLGRIQDTSTISWVFNRLIDENDSVRYQAAFAIGQFFTPQAQQKIKTAIAMEKVQPIRNRLVEAFGKCATNEDALLLLDFIEGSIPVYQKTGCIAAGIISYRGYALHNFNRSLGILLNTAEDPEVRWSSAYALYRSGAPGEFSVLVDVLSREDALTRYFSLKAQGTVISYLKSPQAQQFANTPTVKSILEVVNSREYIQTLVTMLGDSSWFVRLAALEVVEKLKPAPLQDFISLMVEDPNPHIRKSSIATTASYANTFSITFLKNLVENRQDWRESGWALVQLADLDRAYTLKMINSKMSSLSWPENYYLIRALDRIETRNATDLLIKLAQTDDYAQLSTVLESLVNRDPVSKEFYIDKLGTEDPAITTIIASKFGLMKDPQTVPALIGSYQNFEAPKDLEAMVSIITALDSINSPAAIEFLQKQSDSRYSEIRKASRHALQHISGQNFAADTTATLPITKIDFQTDKITEQPRVRVETIRGNFELILYPEKAPLTVANFLELVNKGFYDGIYFHRVVPGFVIQGGDPRGDGWGGPDYAIPCEYNDIFYDRGVLGMAHAGKDTGGSQFFITHTPQPHLNGKHTAFGRVISGMSVVDQIDMYDQIQKAYIIN